MRDLSLVKTIYFDLDDTLCAYWDAAKSGLRATFEIHRFESASIDEMLELWAAEFHEFCPSLKQSGWYEKYLVDSRITRNELMRRTLLKVGCDDEAHVAAIGDTYLAERDRRLSLFPDAMFVLEQLSKRYTLGLITNGPADLQRMEIDTLGIGHFFNHILIEGEVGLGKPLPEIFRIAETAARCEPESLLFVGNSYGHDIRPAIGAGWATAWIRRPSDIPPTVRGVVTAPEQLPAGATSPDLTIGELTDLLPHLA